MTIGNLLKGVKIIENANVITGPFAGGLLAHLGADVIKVEPPGGGDQYREWGTETRGTVRASFGAYNRGKRSIVLDLKQLEGRDMFRRLCASADVVIENSRPGVMDTLGVGWEVLRRDNPALVYCFITGLGSWGPESQRPTYDGIAQALSGLWSQFIDLAAPEPLGPHLADQATGLYAAFAILAGLEHSRRTGEGTKLEVSMLASCIAFLGSNLALFLSDGEVPTKNWRARRSQVYSFVASDGHPLTVQISGLQKFWEALCRAIESPELVNDPRFSTNMSRIANYEELRKILAARFSCHPRVWWERRLREYDVPAAPILSLDEVVAHPQVKALGIIEPADGDSGSWARAPIAIEGHYLGAETCPPLLSEDADLILSEIGISLEEIAQLRKKSVIL